MLRLERRAESSQLMSYASPLLAIILMLIGGLFLANLPESMSSAVVMKNQGGRTRSIILMWGSLMVMTAVGAAIGNLFIADMPPQTQALLEGLAAGAMLTMIAQTMLPEAFDHGGWLTGLMTVFGFLAAIYMGTLDEEKRDEALAGVHIATEISEYHGNEAVQNYSTVTDLARFRG